MKKAIIFILVAVVAVSSAFAFKFNSIGIETGTVGSFVSADMYLVDDLDLDLYGRIGILYSNYFSFTVGAQYKVADFKLDGTKIDVKPGIQTNFSFGDHYFFFSALATCQFAFQAGHLEAFVRPGVGLLVSAYHYGDYKSSDTEFLPAIETGVAYLF